MDKNKFIQACLNWRKVYTFWAINFIVFVIFSVFDIPPLETKIFRVIWWSIIGIITTFIGLYQLIKKQFLDGLLYLCLFLFPIIAYKIGHILKESLLQLLKES